jgi:hypothetical protein
MHASTLQALGAHHNLQSHHAQLPLLRWPPLLTCCSLQLGQVKGSQCVLTTKDIQR